MSTTKFCTAEYTVVVAKSLTAFRQALHEIKLVMFVSKHFHSLELVVLSLNEVKRFDQPTYEERLLKPRHKDGPKEEYSLIEAANIPKEVKNSVNLSLDHG